MNWHRSIMRDQARRIEHEFTAELTIDEEGMEFSLKAPSEIYDRLRWEIPESELFCDAPEQHGDYHVTGTYIYERGGDNWSEPYWEDEVITCEYQRVD